MTVTLKISDNAVSASQQHIAYGNMEDNSFMWHDRSLYNCYIDIYSYNNILNLRLIDTSVIKTINTKKIAYGM